MGRGAKLILMASDHKIQALEERIEELQQEVTDREKDVQSFRDELKMANKKLEYLIGELNKDLRIMHGLQRVLLPTEIPNIPGFEFSTKFVPSLVIGGDYFDIFEHEDKSRFGLIVASSSGPMMSALLLSVLLKLSGQMEARKGSDPETVLKKVIGELLPQMEENSSADLLYAMFDRRNFEFFYTRLGDVVALRYDYASSELKNLSRQKSAVIPGYTSDFKSESVQLNPRDKLIFCSKGLVEVKNLEGEQYGQDRLFKSIFEASGKSVHELRNHIIYQAQKFLSGQEPPRDMTVVVLEVKDRVIKLAKK